MPAPGSELVPRFDFAVGGIALNLRNAAMDGRFEAEGVRREYPISTLNFVRVVLHGM